MCLSDAFVQIVEFFENNAIPSARAKMGEFLTLLAIKLVKLMLVLGYLYLGVRYLAVIDRLLPNLSRTS